MSPMLHPTQQENSSLTRSFNSFPSTSFVKSKTNIDLLLKKADEPWKSLSQN